MRKLTIYGIHTGNGYTFRTMSGDPADTDAYNTLMQVLKQMTTNGGILIWDEGTWDDYVWG